MKKKYTFKKCTGANATNQALLAGNKTINPHEKLSDVNVEDAKKEVDNIKL